MFVKLIDENTIEMAPNVLFDDKKVYANPTEETLRAHGYLPCVEGICPEKEGFYYTYHYEADHDFVYKKWDEHEIIIEEPVVEEPVIEETTAENVQDDTESGQENVQEEEPLEEEVKENDENINVEEPEVNVSDESVEEEPEAIEENEPEAEGEEDELTE